MYAAKKQILKEDGRYLIYYHFPDSATPEQAQTFADLRASAPAEPQKAAVHAPQNEDRPRV